jgi:hypothetical protein
MQSTENNNNSNKVTMKGEKLAAVVDGIKISKADT